MRFETMLFYRPSHLLSVSKVAKSIEVCSSWKKTEEKGSKLEPRLVTITIRIVIVRRGKGNGTRPVTSVHTCSFQRYTRDRELGIDCYVPIRFVIYSTNLIEIFTLMPNADTYLRIISFMKFYG